MKKRFVSLLLILVMLLGVFSFAGCNNTRDPKESLDEDDTSESTSDSASDETEDSSKESEKSSETKKKPTSSDSSYDVEKYNIKKFTQAIWSGDVSYAEAAFVMTNSDGNIEPIQLLYDIDEIVSVRSADLKTLYKEGTDYKVTDGKLEIIKGGKIPFLPYEQYYFDLTEEEYKENGHNTIFSATADDKGKGYIRAEQSSNVLPGMSQWTVAVTYKHAEKNVLTVPQDRSDKFGALIEKLENKETINVAALGDSITYGWSSSANASMSPYCPNYPGIFNDYVRVKYKVTPNYTNFSVSAENTRWALGNRYDYQKVAGYVSPIQEVCNSKPDLVFLAFGMNDGCGIHQSEFVANITAMLNKIKAECPDAMVVVVGTMLPNEKISAWTYAGESILKYHKAYASALKEAESSWTNAVFADVTGLHEELLAIKSYQDMSGSNINHPNDYMHRVYANVVIQTVFGYK